MAAVVTAAIVFAGAEATLTLLPVWEPVGVTTVVGVAPYVLPAELLLGALALGATRWLRGSRPAAAVPVAALVALVYTGAATVGWLLLEQGLFSTVAG